MFIPNLLLLLFYHLKEPEDEAWQGETEQGDQQQDRDQDHLQAGLNQTT